MNLNLLRSKCYLQKLSCITFKENQTRISAYLTKKKCFGTSKYHPAIQFLITLKLSKVLKNSAFFPEGKQAP